MNRDGVKTIIGLLVIGLIIVATFLYGNHQRQAQLRHDQDVKKQSGVTQATPQATPTTNKSASSQASVPSPSANPLQGQGSTSSTSTVKSPQTGGTAIVTPATTPKTGAGEMAPIALVGLALAGIYYRRSRRELVGALIAIKHD